MKKSVFLTGTFFATVALSITTYKILYPATTFARIDPGSRAKGASKPAENVVRASEIAGEARFIWDTKKDAAESERLFREAIALNPKDTFLKKLYAQALFEQGKKSEAYKLFKSTLRPADTSDPDKITNFSAPSVLWSYVEMTRAVGDKQGEAWACREIARTAFLNFHSMPQFKSDDLDRLPVDAIAELAVGLERRNSSRGEEALAIFNSVAKRHPSLALAHLFAAQQYEENVGPGYMPARDEYAKVVKATSPLWTKEYENGVNVKQAAQKRIDHLAEFAYMDGDKFVPATRKSSEPPKTMEARRAMERSRY